MEPGLLPAAGFNLQHKLHLYEDFLLEYVKDLARPEDGQVRVRRKFKAFQSGNVHKGSTVFPRPEGCSLRPLCTIMV